MSSSKSNKRSLCKHKIKSAKLFNTKSDMKRRRFRSSVHFTFQSNLNHEVYIIILLPQYWHVTSKLTCNTFSPKIVQTYVSAYLGWWMYLWYHYALRITCLLFCTKKIKRITYETNHYVFRKKLNNVIMYLENSAFIIPCSNIVTNSAVTAEANMWS